MVNITFLIAHQIQRSFMHLGNDDGGKAEGQIPTIHFLIQWPEHNSKINSSNLSSA